MIELTSKYILIFSGKEILNSTSYLEENTGFCYPPKNAEYKLFDDVESMKKFISENELIEKIYE